MDHTVHLPLRRLPGTKQVCKVLVRIISNPSNTSASREWHPSFTDVEVRPEKLNDLPRAIQLTSYLRPGFKPRYLSPLPILLLSPLEAE